MPRRRAARPAPAIDPAVRAELPPAWEAQVARRLEGLAGRAGRGRPVDRALGRLEREAAGAARRHRARQQTILRPRFDQDLPVVQRRDALAEAIRDHQVVVVCGETGSGKSTQLPQICLALGRGEQGCIAHTQPRRIAARSLSERIASELGTPHGQGVGYRVRFTDQVSAGTRVKLLTDGMLLAETQSDPDLAEYDTVVIDEAHERSLNIDFLLGYLRRLLPRRPDLKLVITSATIDPERFSRHFDGAPVVEVSGRSFPVEVRYRPLHGEEDERDRSLLEGLLDAVDELASAGPGDVLVFLPGEREIREAAEALRKHHPAGTEILPLYGRLSSAEQQRVFSPHGGRRVVLATNVAETSITVPGIRYVVDSGLVRLSRYSYRTKVQRLPVEPVSQASADQRAGRCGRVAPGICIRLYGEEDYAGRPRYTDPEILRTNLAAVILQMKHLRLGAVEEFPFIDPPDARYVRDGMRLLRELGALDVRERLTALGERLARLPVDPRIARMLVEADRERSLAETLVVAAALSIQDPRERPLQARQAADEAHGQWQEERSDFLALLKLWDAFLEAARHLSRNKLRAWCRERFLSYLRMLEWRDIHQQLRTQVKAMGFRENEEPADYPMLHRSLLAGLLGNVAVKVDEGGYQGARNLKLAIFPGSGLARRRPKWIMAAELVETSRVFARTCAEIRPEWVETLAGDLASRRYGEAFFEERSGRVGIQETVSLYGLPIVPRRRANCAQVDPVTARAVFISEALVAGRLRRPPEFLRHNLALRAELEALEARLRRREILVDEQSIEAFYDRVLPAEVCDGPSLRRWLSRQRDVQGLYLDRDTLLARPDLHGFRARDFPERLSLRGLELPLRYRFAPGEDDDGVTVQVPLPALNQLSSAALEWLVPGLLHEKAVALIKALPKRLRRHFVPAPDFAAEALAALAPSQGSLAEGLRQELHRMTGIDVPMDAWEGVELPAHLKLRVEVLGEDGRVLAAGRDLATLREHLGSEASQEFSRSGGREWERTGIRRWDFGELPERVELSEGGARWYGYPAVRDDQGSVALVLADSPEAAERISRAGVLALFMRELSGTTRYLKQNVPGLERLCLWYAPLGPCRELRGDILDAVYRLSFLADDRLPRTQAEFRERLAAGRGALDDTLQHVGRLLEQALERFHRVRRALKGPSGLGLMDSLRDLSDHLDSLVYRGFLREVSMDWLEQLPRYLEGLLRRAEKLERDPARDQRLTAEVRPAWERYRQRAEAHAARGIRDPELAAYRRMLEEWRVSLFAQEIGTAFSVSAKRLEAQWKKVQ